ncbi:MAG: magnesium transporter [Desulfurococcaceae archaeon]
METIATRIKLKIKKWLTPLITLAVAEVLAGLVLRFNVDLLVAYPVLLVLIPGLMDLRGDVYGAIGYRLTKALHLGLTSPSLRSRFNMVNALLGYVVSTVATVNLSFIGLALSILTGLEAPDLISLLFISLFSTFIVYIMLTPIITTSTIVMFKHGHDPSSFVATIVTGIGDFTTPAILLIMAYLHQELSHLVKLLVTVVIIALAIVFAAFIIREKESRNLVENTVSSIIASTGSSFGGFALALSTQLISRSPEILGVLPAFNAVIGAAMGYLGSALNIDLHIEAEVPVKSYYEESAVGFIATYFSIMLALTLSSTPLVVDYVKLARIIGVVTASCFSVYVLSMLITYLLTTLTFKHGWDPDNVVFPVMTTFVDLIGPVVISLAGSIVL